MAKGCTKFDGTAVNSRSKKPKTLSNQDLAKALEVYKRTGNHPIYSELSHKKNEQRIPSLPIRDLMRPHVYMEISINGVISGQLVFELFESQAREAVKHLKRRCSANHHYTILGTTIQKIHTGIALYGQIRRKNVLRTYPKTKCTSLHHTDSGILSLSHDGGQLAITLTKTLWLEKEFQVIGRLCYGDSCLKKLGNLDTDKNGKPLQNIIIGQCGLCSHLGPEINSNFSGPLNTSRYGVEIKSPEASCFKQN